MITNEQLIQECLDDCRIGMKDCDPPDSDIYKGWVEALEYVLKGKEEDEYPEVTEEEQRLFNKFADSFMLADFHHTNNGIFSSATVIDLVEGLDEYESYHGDWEPKNFLTYTIPDTDKYPVWIIDIQFGRQDDCHDETYSRKIGIFKSYVDEWLAGGWDQKKLPNWVENPEY